MKYNLQGFDYYIGGVFQTTSSRNPPIYETNLIPGFDWRDRHGANNENSPYFDGDNIQNGGWITKIQNQDPCFSCYAFSPVACIEAYTNLYFNNNVGNPDQTIKHHIDVDLSELVVMRCPSYHVDCQYENGSNQYISYNYIKDTGVGDENSFEYQFAVNNPDCSEKDPPTDIIKLTNFRNSENFLNNADILKVQLIKFGPISLHRSIGLGHYILLVGYHTNAEGDTVYKGDGPENPPIVLDENSELIETTSWILKDSYGGNVFLNEPIPITQFALST